MRFKPGTRVLVSLVDGSSIDGTTARSWRWRTLRLEGARFITANRPAEEGTGYTLVPARSILIVQVG